MENRLPDAVDYAALDRLGEEIAEFSAHLEAATARLLDLIREFDERGGWNTGFSSCAAWLSWRVGLDLGAARERVRVARALANLPRLAQALARGELSYAKVRALTRVATPETEERLLAVGRAGTACHVEQIVRGWRRVDRIAETRETALRHSRRALRVYQDEDGMVIRGRLAPEAGAALMQALAAARDTLYQQRRQRFVDDVSAETPPLEQQQPPFEQQQADALTLLAESALHHGIDPGRERYQVVVYVDAPVLTDADAPGQSVLQDDSRVSAETSQRLACDASRIVMQHARSGRVVEVAARTRTIPPALRRALHHRDRGCRFPGCFVRFGEGHHIRHWARGGPTTLSNLALLCRRHHRAVHEEGYQLERLPDGELQFRRPNGRVLPDVPPPPRVPDEPVETLRALNDAEGLVLHAHTATPSWRGERLDVVYAIDRCPAPGGSGPSRSGIRTRSSLDAGQHRPVLRRGPAIPVRRGQRHRKVAERLCLARQERTCSLLLVRKNGGRATAVFHLARNQTHLAGATTASTAAEHNPRPGAQDRG